MSRKAVLLLSIILGLPHIIYPQQTEPSKQNTVSGNVFLFDATGKPATQWPVKIVWTGQQAEKEEFIGVTNSKGQLQLWNLAPGKYEIQPVRQPPAMKTTLEVKPVDAKSTAPPPFTKTIRFPPPSPKDTQPPTMKK